AVGPVLDHKRKAVLANVQFLEVIANLIQAKGGGQDTDQRTILAADGGGTADAGNVGDPARPKEDVGFRPDLPAGLPGRRVPGTLSGIFVGLVGIEVEWFPRVVLRPVIAQFQFAGPGITPQFANYQVALGCSPDVAPLAGGFDTQGQPGE